MNYDFAEILDTPVGQLQFVAGSAVAESVKKHFHHDPGVEFFMDRYRDHLFPFLDVGANVGIFSILAVRKQVGESIVLAFEPDERNLALLRENIKTTGSAVTVYPVACGAVDGSIEMGTMTCGRSSKSKDNIRSLPARSINSVVTELGIAPGFIKLDIEGGETDALLGLEGEKCERSILEIEFSWRDHGERFGEWTRLRPPGEFFWEFLLSPSEKMARSEPIDLLGRQFLLTSANDEQGLAGIIDVLQRSTAERPSRKWELCITPKEFRS